MLKVSNATRHHLTAFHILFNSTTMEFTNRELGLIAHLLGMAYCDLDTPNSGNTWTFERYGKDAVVGAFKKVQRDIQTKELDKESLELKRQRVPLAKESAFGLDRDFEVLGLYRKDQSKIKKRPTSFYC